MDREISQSPGLRSLAGKFLRRWAASALGLWVLGMLLFVQAEYLWPWGRLQGLVGLVLHIAEAMSTPAAPFAHRIVGDTWQEHLVVYYGLRFGFASVFYGLGPAAIWPAFTPSRGVDSTPGGLSRREIVARGGATLAAAAIGAPAAWASVVVPGRLRLRSFDVAIPDLPAALDGLVIAHISDTHFGPLVSRGHVERAVELANAQQPDLAVLTGDYVYRTPRSVHDGIGMFGELRARLGTVAVMGNHDHFVDADGVRRRFAELDIPLLENVTLFLTPDGLRTEEVPLKSLALVGTADLAESRPAPRMASRFISPLCPRLLISHHPDVAERFPTRFPELHYDLQLSGHTHGGQILIPGHGAPIIPSEYGTKYAGGLVEGPAWPVIVSRGVGMAVAPLRWGVCRICSNFTGVAPMSWWPVF